MKTLVLILGCLLLLTPCKAAENRRGQEEQLKEVENYVSQQHLALENYYRNQFSELNERALSKIRLLEVADNVTEAGLAAQADVAISVLNTYYYGYEVPPYLAAETERSLQPRGVKKPQHGFENELEYASRRFALAQNEIAERKNRILANLKSETLMLERQKQYALTEGLTQFEKQLKEETLKPEPKATHGMITGILYSADKPSALVDREIVHEGDTIDGVTVVKISEDKVEFRKNNRTWEQKVQQKPNANW